MLAEERHRRILGLLNAQKTVMVSELCMLLNTSESTIRRDLACLAQRGLLTKVHGGAASNPNTYITRGVVQATRQTIHEPEKQAIGRYAASLVESDDFVYLDGGSTVEKMIDYLNDANARFVTCSIRAAQRLTQMGKDILLLGGHYNEIADSLMGVETQHTLLRYHFTKGFFGVTGITRHAGHTAVIPEDAMIKQQALNRCRNAYILADPGKFGVVCAVTFAEFDSAQIITTKLTDARFQSCENIVQTER